MALGVRQTYALREVAHDVPRSNTCLSLLGRSVSSAAWIFFSGFLADVVCIGCHLAGRARNCITADLELFVSIGRDCLSFEALAR